MEEKFMFPRILGLLGALGLSLSMGMGCKQTAGPDRGPVTPPGEPERLTARATLQPAAGSEVKGEVTFEQTKEGVRVHVQVEGLTPGQHGFHIHERGDCSAPDFSSAGEHYAPNSHPHGPPGAMSHAGDLGNLEANADGEAEQSIVTQQLASEQDLRKIVGKAVIIHAKADDFTTQPSGASGDRVACGVIEVESDS
jgi:superoxide dismutase, Cu-Zn family